MADRDITSTVKFPDLKPEDAFRPNLAAEIDDTRTWVDPRGYRLSDRLWSAKAADRAQIEGVLRGALARGASPLQTARALEHLLNPYYQPRRDPDTFRILPKSKQPPGVVTKTPRQGPGKGPFRPRNSGLGSYAARRLARTETTRAFGDATMKAAMANPFVHRMRWRLSGHHHDADQCDMNAANSSRHNAPGVYWLNEVPRYPDHPQEMCTLNPVVEAPDIADAIPRIREYIRTGHLPPPQFQETGASLLPFNLSPTGARLGDDGRVTGRQEGDTRPEWVQEISDISARQQNRFNISGDVDEAEIRRAGALVRANLKAESAEIAARKKRIEVLQREHDDLGDVLQRGGYSSADDMVRMYKRRDELSNEMWALRNEGRGNAFGAQVRDTLAEVRDMGSKKKHPFAKGSNNIGKTHTNAVRDDVPTEWWESSIAGTPLRTRKIARGHYQHNLMPRNGEWASELNISGYGKRDLQDAAMHEFGHRMEYTRPAIRAAEQSFYERRTAGEDLVSLKKLKPNYGYRENEVVRPDQFSELYSGKDYKGRAYEIVSMGIEDVLRTGRAPEWIDKDEDYLDFILGVLAVL